MGKAPASAQKGRAPHLTEATPTKIIRAPTLRQDTPDSLEKPIRAVTIRSQADRGIQVVTPGSRLEATRTKQGAPMEEDT